MRKIIAVSSLTFAFACQSAQTGQPDIDDQRFEEVIQETEPERTFFMTTLEHCAYCKTVTIIISENELDSEEISVFKAISTELGKNHAGAVVSPRQALRHYKVFSNYGCNTHGLGSQRLIFYIDTDESYCGAFKYSDEVQLREAIHTILQHIDGATTLERAKWVQMVKHSVRRYSESYDIVSGAQPVLEGLIEYIAKHLYE